MKELLKKDISLKILSVLAAIVLWVILSPNPTRQVEMNIKLNVINEATLSDIGIKLVDNNYPKYATISVRVRKEDINAIKNTDFEIALDFARVKSENDKRIILEKPVYLGTANILPEDIKLMTKDISINFGKIEENPFRVQIETKGNTKEGFEIVSATSIPETISIQGLDSEIKAVAKVVASIDVTGIDTKKSYTTKYRVYDKNSREIYEFSNRKNVEILLNVAKRVPLKINLRGTPEKNYFISKSLVSPSSVLVTGDINVLSKLNTIDTEGILVDKLDSDKTFSTYIILPDGITLVDSTREVVVNLQIEEK